jgi:hypothetical protein
MPTVFAPTEPNTLAEVIAAGQSSFVASRLQFIVG